MTRRRLIQVGMAFGAALTFGAGLRLDVPAPGARLLSAEELSVVSALALAFFPGAPMPVDGVQAGVVAEVDRLLADIVEEPAQSAFRYTLRAIEWGTLVTRGQRFSQLSLEERAEVLDVWSDPSVVPRRAGLDLLRTLFGMAYFSNRQVLDHMGWRVGCKDFRP